jgi:hypothetical protein
MKVDLEELGMCLNKSFDKNIHMIEKMTQTELFPMSSTLSLNGTPNGTSPCNHPSLSCQVRHLMQKERNKPRYFNPGTTRCIQDTVTVSDITTGF